MFSMKRARFIAPLAVLAISAIIGGILIATAPEAERRVPAPLLPTVEVMPLRSQDYTVTITTRGTVSPRTQSTLVAEVSGRITTVSPNFRAGGFFETGDVLLTIDPRDYENTVTIMRAELAQARFGLKEEEARANQARIDWKRLGDNGKPGDLVLRKPQLASKQASVAAAEAQLRQAELNLERTRIMAPYAGRILEKSVDVGQHVSPGTVLASLYAVDYVEIRLPLTDEQLAFVDLPETYRNESSPTLSSTSPQQKPGPLVTVSIRLGGNEHRWVGNIIRAEGAIDTKSRQLFVVAQIDDPYAREGKRPPLKVGRFVEAKIQGRTLRGVFVLPSIAVRIDDEIWLVDKDKRLARRPVEVLWRNEGHVVIGKGPRDGESLVVTSLPYGVSGTVVNIANGDGKQQ
uniref:RND family efflux transporter, MFP subunit n=1 Tax=Candidatus Kentrum sp. SD TaxID=2126332 RepID=A0A451BNJ9_9GAMM|nr:MAG: RND family efflux transporter, MFP subunit [Candidatus Kentron sp. SD]VFK45553.1 MAG: RND family efflux transporter, MFP subunit [Candidatus Kentron sp. SD]VFK79850.1 MAG: RND family efflux transporter, MFP subunit [Candidatus Kentron sp. SD]